MNTGKKPEKIQYGDYSTVGKMLGMSRQNVEVTLRRPDARRHQEVQAALKKVIEARERLINEHKKEQ